MKLEFYKITECRACRSQNLEFVFTLGELKSCGYFPRTIIETVPSGDLTLVICMDCTLVQLDRNFDTSLLFGGNYGYKSSLNNSMVKHLHTLAVESLKYRGQRQTHNILDIGSNDGTLVNFFSELNVGSRLFACDPSILQFESSYNVGIHKFADFFSLKLAKQLANDFGQMDLITSIAMFYDLPNPVDFVTAIKSILAEDGTWIIEMTTLDTILNFGSIDSICHEHLEYYSYYSLELMLNKQGLFIDHVDINESNSGSIRLYVEKQDMGHKMKKYHPTYEFNSEEIKNELREVKKNLDLEILKIRDFLEEKVRENKVVYALGASTKGNTLLQYANLNNTLIKAVAEINPDKFDCFTPGTAIPIVDESTIDLSNVASILVLPWHFRKGIIESKKDYLSNGGTLIFPFPKFEIYNV